MRTVLNISLPPELVKEIKVVAKDYNFSSVSEFIRELALSFMADQKLISDLEKSRRDIKAGRVQELKSWDDLFE